MIEINFDDNEIRSTETNPFLLFPNLETISLKNNMISELSKGMLIVFEFCLNEEDKTCFRFSERCQATEEIGDVK